MLKINNPLEISYKVTSGYGMRGKEFHYGVDLVGEGNKVCDVVNCFDGEARVVRSYLSSSAGNTVILEYQDKNYPDSKFIAIYCHLEECYIDAGVIVKIGEKLGKMGNTGKSKGIHLHFQYSMVDKNMSLMCSFGKLGNLNPIDYIK